jgi:hypothetical protein
MRHAMRFLLWLAITPTVFAQSSAPPSPNSTRLPVKRVILYKNGVGYFEHAGLVSGSEEVNIDFTTHSIE